MRVYFGGDEPTWRVHVCAGQRAPVFTQRRGLVSREQLVPAGLWTRCSVTLRSSTSERCHSTGEPRRRTKVRLETTSEHFSAVLESKVPETGAAYKREIALVNSCWLEGRKGTLNALCRLFQD